MTKDLTKASDRWAWRRCRPPGLLCSRCHSCIGVLEHHGGKLLVGDLSIAVGINLIDDLLDNSLVQVLSEGKHLLDLVRGDGTTAVLVKHLESRVQFVVA